MQRNLVARLIVVACAVTLVAASTAAGEPEFQLLFNGKDLSGWSPEPGLWRVKDGVIEGGHPDGGPVERSSFMPVHRDGQDTVFKDFHFKAEFYIEDSNSGVQYRSTRLHPQRWSVGGYQYEVSGGFATGFLYHQSHSGPHVRVGYSMINDPDQGGLLVGYVADQRWLYQQKFRTPSEWGRCDIICRGNHIVHFANGYPTIEYIDRDEITPDRKRRNDDGIIALQIHSAKDKFRVRYRNLWIKEFADKFGEAQRVFNDRDFDGWRTPAGESTCWMAHAALRDERGRLKEFSSLICDGTGRQPLALEADHGPSYVFRCQVKSDDWKPGEDAPYRDVAGWSLLEVEVRNGKPRVEFNGRVRTDLPVPVAAGKVALPSDVKAEYRNLVLIPIVAE